MPQAPKWKNSSPELIALFEEIAPRGEGIVHKKVFGWPCCFLQGNLFLGLHKENVIFRLSQNDLAAFLKLDGAGEFEPMAGRKMKGYGILADPVERDRKMLAQWIQRSLDLAHSLQPKEPKKPEKGARTKTSIKRRRKTAS
jgi:hypothetical protein